VGECSSNGASASERDETLRRENIASATRVLGDRSSLLRAAEDSPIEDLWRLARAVKRSLARTTRWARRHRLHRRAWSLSERQPTDANLQRRREESVISWKEFLRGLIPEVPEPRVGARTERMSLAALREIRRAYL